jgi:5-methylcytosine-specific restriction endonuclease McrA
MRPELTKAILSGNVLTFYKSREWQQKRREILTRDKECIHCKRMGKYSHADTVHHIIHLRANPSLALADTNLISLCKSCHDKEHPEKLHPQEAKGYINQERW